MEMEHQVVPRGDDENAGHVSKEDATSPSVEKSHPVETNEHSDAEKRVEDEV